ALRGCVRPQRRSDIAHRSRGGASGSREESETRLRLLVDPAAPAFAAVLFIFFRSFMAFVVAMLVEEDGAVVFAHVDLEFARHTLPLPAVIGIPNAREEGLARRLGDFEHAVGESAADAARPGHGTALRVTQVEPHHPRG